MFLEVIPIFVRRHTEASCNFGARRHTSVVPQERRDQLTTRSRQDHISIRLSLIERRNSIEAWTIFLGESQDVENRGVEEVIELCCMWLGFVGTLKEG